MSGEWPALPVWPRSNVRGWAHPHDPASQEADAYTAVPLDVALATMHDTDAHITGYRARSDGAYEDPTPRLKAAALSTIKDAGGDVAVLAVFIDLDRVPHKPWPTLHDAEEAALELLDRYSDTGEPLEHAGIYTTSSGLRLVFLPDRPIAAEHYKATMGQPAHRDERGRAKPDVGFLGYLRRMMADGLQELGLELDKTCNQWTRCMRLPLVMRGGKATQSFQDHTQLRPLSFTTWLSTAANFAPIAGVLDASSDRPQGDDLAAWEWTRDQWVESGLQRQLGRKWPGLYRALKAGRPWYRTGERNAKCYDAVAMLAELLEETQPRVLYAVTWRSVAEGAAREGTTELGTALDELWGMCCARAGVEVQRAQERVDRAARAEKAREALVATGLGPEGQMLPPIVVHGSAYYVLDARDPANPKYSAPTSNSVVLNNLLELGCDGLDLDLYNPMGGFRPLAALVRDYGFVAARVVMTLHNTPPRIDGDTMRVPVVKALDVEPVFHKDVDHWLRALGGDDAAGLLDWLATLMELDRPTCAIYIHGRKGCGKGMLAAAVASMWGEAPTSFREATGRFNAALSRSPVVFLDEGVAVKRDEAENVSSAFRSLTGNTEHRVEAKGMPTSVLEGCPRVVVAANNPEALPLDGGHTAEDIEAVAERVRYFRVRDGEAQAMLGWDVTREWVRNADGRPGAIAEHIRWLAQERTVDRSGRFLVAGVVTDYHRGLAVTSVRLDALAAVAYAVGMGDGAEQKGVVLSKQDDGVHILVNARKLRTSWNTLTGDKNTPGQRQLTGAFLALDGVTTTRHKDRRFYDIPHRWVLLAADRAQVSTTRTLRKHLGIPLDGLEEEPVAPTSLRERALLEAARSR